MIQAIIITTYRTNISAVRGNATRTPSATLCHRVSVLTQSVSVECSPGKLGHENLRPYNPIDLPHGQGVALTGPYPQAAGDTAEGKSTSSRA